MNIAPTDNKHIDELAQKIAEDLFFTFSVPAIKPRIAAIITAHTHSAPPALTGAFPVAASLPLKEREALSDAGEAAARQFNRHPGNFLKIAQAAIAAYTARLTS